MIAIKVDAVGRGVVVHAVENDLDAFGGGLGAKGLEERRIAQVGVHRLVVVGIIAVIAAALDDRREIDGRDALVLQVGQLVDHALQIAAGEVAVVGAGHAPVFGGRVPGGVISRRNGAVEGARVGVRVVGAVAVAEAVGE